MAEADSDISVSELGVVEGAVVSLMGGGEIASGQLQVLCHGDPEDDDPSNVVFLSLDGWVYPLLPGMPAVAVKPLFYLLPASDGSRYALQLPEDVDEEQATTLEAVFVRYARFVRVSKADGEEAEEEEPAEAETADEGEEKEGDDGSEGAAAAAMSSLKSMSARFGKKAKSARSKGVALLGRMAADVKAEAAARSAASGTDEGEEAATSSEEVAVSVDGEEEGEEEDDSRKKTAKATKIAHGIEKGSVIVAAGLVAGAKMTGKGMKKNVQVPSEAIGQGREGAQGVQADAPAAAARQDADRQCCHGVRWRSQGRCCHDSLHGRTAGACRCAHKVRKDVGRRQRRSRRCQDGHQVVARCLLHHHGRAG
eukprot:PLAT3810.1.p1 GENE.PLAT3810.1~~PLAT3810.1.p1  ORF type:complete len:367 (+),score=91.95 PLAT3810.1:84-1184(+)